MGRGGGGGRDAGATGEGQSTRVGEREKGQGTEAEALPPPGRRLYLSLNPYRRGRVKARELEGQRGGGVRGWELWEQGGKGGRETDGWRVGRERGRQLRVLRCRPSSALGGRRPAQVATVNVRTQEAIEVLAVCLGGLCPAAPWRGLEAQGKGPPDASPGASEERPCGPQRRGLGKGASEKRPLQASETRPQKRGLRREASEKRPQKRGFFRPQKRGLRKEALSGLRKEAERAALSRGLSGPREKGLTAVAAGAPLRPRAGPLVRGSA